MTKPEISIIISTYNAEEWLEKVLWSYEAQNFKDFEIVIADDGSKKPTFDLLERIQKEVSFPIIHVWHEDNGFQKTIILNKSIVKCNADYILMSDGDCIVRQDFVATHVGKKERGYFLSGGYFKLPMDISLKISKENIVNQDCFNLKWLVANGLKPSFKNNKLNASPLKAKILNTITPTNASWNGHNASGWKKDILAVNGFDERMQYGGEDREMGERLFNKGIKSKQIRYNAICLHLDHARGYVSEEAIEKNQKIRATVKNDNLKWTDYGILQDS